MDSKNIAGMRHFRICFTKLILVCLLYFYSSVLLNAQSPAIGLSQIEEFTQILKNQENLLPLEITDLSNNSFVIYWLYSDRRSADEFHKRISSYAGDKNVELRYRWTWPDDIPVDSNHYNLFVYGKDMTFPSRYNSYSNIFRIRIGHVGRKSFDRLSLPNSQGGIMDLAAQYIMNGIRLNSNGKIITGDRISYLPASYFGLDEDFINHQFDSIINLSVQSGAFPGAELYIAYKGSVIYSRSDGHHTYERNYPVRDHDLYDLASLTKVVGGVNALMTMYDHGEFDPEKTLGDYFPYFRGSDKGDLGLKRILTHSAGLTPYMVYYNMAEKDNGGYYRNTISPTLHGNFNYRIADSIFVSDKFNRFIYKAIKDSPLKSGHEYKYSGLFFLLIPDLVRQQTGESLDQYLYSNIFHPLGDYNTTYNPSTQFNIHQIVPTEYDQVWRHKLVHGQVHDEAAAVLEGVSGNAGLFSTGNDLIKIGETWRRNGEYGGKRYWSSKTIKTFTKCYYCDEGNRRALGFDRPPLPDQPANSYMSPLASQESYGHSGFTGTMIWVDPAVDYTFVFLSNRVNPTRKNTKIYSLNIRPALHSVLYEAIKRGRQTVR